MKSIVTKVFWIFVLVAGMWIVVSMMGNNDVTYVKPETIETEVIKEVNHLDPLYAEREAELAEKYRKIQSIEARIDVNQAEIDRLQEQILADRKELSSFMTATASGN